MTIGRLHNSSNNLRRLQMCTTAQRFHCSTENVLCDRGESGPEYHGLTEKLGETTLRVSPSELG